MTENQLYQQQSAQKALGDRGEDFVLTYERRRLANHHGVGAVRIVGRSDVALGYDVLSFHGLGSEAPDRYIEVKTFSGSPHFFLSQTEYEAAQRYGYNYCIYLVDIGRVDDPCYEPHIIQDPLRNLSSQGWTEKIVTREYSLKTAQDMLPDDFDASTVLIGCYTTNQHLTWILHNHAYNVRSSFISGAVNKDEVTTGVKYLVLYWVREPRTYSVYKVDDGINRSKVSVATRSDMLRMQYPNPHAQEYILYSLVSKAELPPIDIMHVLRTINDKMQRPSGAPVYMSGHELRRYLLGTLHNKDCSPERTFTNSGRPWTEDQKQRLATLYTIGKDIAQLAHDFKRSADEIRSQLYVQGLIASKFFNQSL